MTEWDSASAGTDAVADEFGALSEAEVTDFV